MQFYAKKNTVAYNRNLERKKIIMRRAPTAGTAQCHFGIAKTT